MQQAVIFVRVSKKEQDYQRQVEDLRAVAQSQGVQVVAEIAERGCVSNWTKNYAKHASV